MACNNIRVKSKLGPICGSSCTFERGWCFEPFNVGLEAFPVLQEESALLGRASIFHLSLAHTLQHTVSLELWANWLVQQATASCCVSEHIARLSRPPTSLSSVT